MATPSSLQTGCQYQTVVNFVNIRKIFKEILSILRTERPNNFPASQYPHQEMILRNVPPTYC